ncbi:MAG: hypothetical protein AB7L36_05075 [Sphingomonadaceae bacterium]
MPDPLFHIAEIGVGMKEEEAPRLFEHFRRASRCELAHAISNHVFDRNDRYFAIVTEIDEPDAITISHAIEERAGYNLKAKFEIGVNPAARRHAGAGWTHEAKMAKLDASKNW